MTTFSVVIPLYNKESMIQATLNSVLAQTFPDFEIVVVDDGSTDGGPVIVGGYNDPRIRLFTQANRGVSAARNRGVAEARGKYIAFIDGDDEWAPGFLEAIFEAAQRFPSANLFGTSSIHRDVVTGSTSDSTVPRYAGKSLEVQFFENPHVMPHTSAMVVSREAFFSSFPDGEGFPTGMRLCEDFSCFYRLALSNKIVYIGRPLSVRNNNLEGQTTRMTADERFRKLPDIEKFHRILSEAADTTPNPLVGRFQRYELRHRFLSHIRSGDEASIRHLIANLDKKTISRLTRLERFLYLRRNLWLAARFFILATKAIWRLHGYPVSGK
ncbi:MAG: hypothetical protein RL173_488 [Fibrobacterota bacterium]|jgi:glycosyltransferase involved in cell wall biosynthesis